MFKIQTPIDVLTCCGGLTAHQFMVKQLAPAEPGADGEDQEPADGKEEGLHTHRKRRKKGKQK